MDEMDETRPQGLISSAPERLQATHELSEVIRGQLPNLTARADDTPKVLAVAALARSNRLLEAMVCLRQGGIRDVVDIGVRPIMESLLLALYCMLGGQDAADHVRGAYIRQLSQLSEDITKHLPPYEPADNWDGPIDRINWETLSKQVVGQLVTARCPNETGAVAILTRLYDGTYRAHSGMSIHAGVGSFGPHAHSDGRTTAISAEAHKADDGTAAILMAAALVGITAHFVFEVYGLSTTKIDQINVRVSSGIEFDTLIIPPSG